MPSTVCPLGRVRGVTHVKRGVSAGFFAYLQRHGLSFVYMAAEEELHVFPGYKSTWRTGWTKQFSSLKGTSFREIRVGFCHRGGEIMYLPESGLTSPANGWSTG